MNITASGYPRQIYIIQSMSLCVSLPFCGRMLSCYIEPKKIQVNISSKESKNCQMINNIFHVYIGDH